MKTLLMTVGLPRSGKSTWAMQQGMPVVNPDSIRLAVYGQRFFGDGEPFVWAVAKAMVRALFLAGHDTVILDATNGTRKRRDEWISKDWRREFKVFYEGKEACLSRADEELKPVIERMATYWEPIDSDERDDE